VSDAPGIGVGLLGYAFMGEAHSRALLALQHLDVPLRPELVSISGRDRAKVEAARARWGWSEAVTDWREQVADERIALFDNGGPNAVHAEPTIAAAKAGKHVLCEKPLALDAAEAQRMWAEAESAGVVHMTGFNYRFVPAVRLAREILESGQLGDVVHFRARYLQSWGWEADESVWRFDRAQAGTGAIGDLGAHIIDIARYLVGEIDAVSAVVTTFVPGRRVDDHFAATVEFENGVVGTLEASRLARERDDLRKQNAQLREEIRLLNTPEDIERIAREQLGLVKPGEVAVILVAPSPAPAATDVRPELSKPVAPLPDPWWTRLWRRLTR